MNWIFGYGSLIWRPGLAYTERVTAILSGWRRSFAQLSVDHRGTPDFPGRVLTLRPSEASDCIGVAYKVEAEQWQETIDYLDDRERGGYDRANVSIQLKGTVVEAITYIAPPGNPHDAGYESYDTIAQIILKARGPSGPNDEYIWALYDALRGEGIEDIELAAIVNAMKSHMQPSN